MTTRHWFSSRDARRSAAGALLLALVSACALSRVVRIAPHQIDRTIPFSFNSLELDVAIRRGFLQEVVQYVEMLPLTRRENPRVLAPYGRALASGRRYSEALRVFENARTVAGRGSFTGGEIGWLMTKTAFQKGDLAAAAAYAAEAQESGFAVPPGWARFLTAFAKASPTANVVTGHRTRVGFEYGEPRVPRIDVTINGRKTEAVVDTGAALTLISESRAAELGIVPIAESDAEGSGLHNTRFPVKFAWIDELRIGDLTISAVPVGVIPDWALEFEGAKGIDAGYRYRLLLGCHLWKEFTVTLDYGSRRLLLEHTEAEADAALFRTANLFVAEGKPMVRGTMNGEAFYRFLLDTGSELTLVHRAGVDRYRGLVSRAPVAPVTVHGIGKSRGQWEKIREVTLGFDRFQVFFEDLLMTDDGEADDDAILGSSYLDNFVVVLDFPRLRASVLAPEPTILFEPGSTDPIGVRIEENPASAKRGPS